jgi:photosystem II stability/assembly factor-like uncharacterized protein
MRMLNSSQEAKIMSGRKIIAGLALLLIFGFVVYADIVDREKGFETHLKMSENSVFKNTKWKGIGPYFMGGRITDIAAYDNNDYTFLLATASGGLWKTKNNGTTWESIFDNYSSITLGDIAVSQTDEKLIWAGTGEENSSRSSYAGTGVFKSIDSGKTWKNMGLKDSHHIAEIIIDPRDNNTVYVAVIGHLYTKNEERGVFKTTDGGKNWNKILFISNRTGVVDLVMDPNDNKMLYAASWDRQRKAWNMTESGTESSIYKTSDGGKTWNKVVNGFPQDKYTGRIGLSISRSNPKVIYAFLDNQMPRPKKKKKKMKGKSGITAELLMKMKKEDFLKLSDKRISSFLKEVDAPKEFTAEMVKKMIESDQISLKFIASSVSKMKDANYKLLNSTVHGAEVYRSNDKGKTWLKTHKGMLAKGIVSTYGYYFGQIYVSPKSENVVYILGVPLKKSIDGAKTFKTIPDSGGSYGTGLFDVHPDHHAMWIDPKNPNRILLGNDGGLNISYDGGDNFTKINNIPLAQSYSVNYDMQVPYRVYTGLQDNGVNLGPSNFTFGNRTNNWRMILGGDGAFVEPDLNNPDTVYAEFQFGNIFRVDLKGKNTKRIVPESKDPQKPYRFNWLSPFKISKHNPYTLYMGGNKMLKSINRGDKWFEISSDLTDKKHTDGDVPYATITAIDESSLSPQILYAGTDDGNVWVTRNSGADWTKINSTLPKKWVTRIIASKFKESRVFVTMTGYRDDDFKTYVFMSNDYGKKWVSIKSNLPEESVNVIREDINNENILYLGTELTVYITLDLGKNWFSLRGDLPTNAVYDLRIHPREQDLIIGMHGRGVYITNVKNIRKLTGTILSKDLHVFKTDPYEISKNKNYFKINRKFEFYLKNQGAVEMKVFKGKGKKPIWKKKQKFDAGINYFEWNMKIKKNKIKQGNYIIVMKYGKKTEKSVLEVKF